MLLPRRQNVGWNQDIKTERSKMWVQIIWDDSNKSKFDWGGN
jgi:hypothetical protein